MNKNIRVDSNDLNKLIRMSKFKKLLNDEISGDKDLNNFYK